MKVSFLGSVVFGVVLLIGLAVLITLLVLGIVLIKALIRYIKSKKVRAEKAVIKKSLGEVLKQHRVDCKMTQEFVAESLGVSRQAVSDNLTRTEALLRKMEDSIGCVGRDLKNRNALRTILDAAERLKTYPDETVSVLAGEIIEAAQDFEE